MIRNAGELMWRDSLTVKPGTVQVAVLPPIDVSAWPADQVRNKTREVQAMFEDTLAHWPGEPRPAPKDPKPPAEEAGRREEGARQEGRPRRRRSPRRRSPRSAATDEVCVSQPVLTVCRASARAS